MKTLLHFVFFFILSLSIPVKSVPLTSNSAIVNHSPRRILHQPLFPVTSSPQSYPPPPPPPPPPDSSEQQPFFNEQPTGSTSDQSPPPPPSNGTIPIPAATQPSKPTKTLAVAISVGIVTLGMLSALVFFLYRHRTKHPTETQKLVGDNNSRRFPEDSRAPPSSFLYIGTVEPSQNAVIEPNSANGVNSSPYNKLNSIKRPDRFERYRPSPELHPLPPLPIRPAMNSPSEMMSSSDEESHETVFHTPQASSVVSFEDGYNSPVSRRHNSVPNSSEAQVKIVPHSKRTSPKSRRFVPTANQAQPPMRTPSPPPPPPPPTTPLQPLMTTPSPPPPPPPPPTTPLQPQIQTSQEKTMTCSPRKLKFSSPPPPPNLAALQSLSNGSASPKVSKFMAKQPPPPPPPPPPLGSLPRIVVGSDESGSARPSQVSSEFQSLNPPRPKSNSISGSGMSNSVEGVSSNTSSENHDSEGVKPRLKPLHWDKVRATSDRATVWDQLKSSSFQLNEDMMESLFGCKSVNSAPKKETRKLVLPPVEKENRVLDPKKSQNIAILLRALNVTLDEVSEALMDGNPEGLGPELLETLVKMAPTKEEEIKLRDYRGDISKLGSAERFLKAVLDIPFAFKRVEAMLYRANFDAEVKYLRNCFQTLEAASEELKNSRLFLSLLEAVLRTGNRMNVGTNRGDAKSFKLDTLLKLVDIKGTDGKTTLLHFVVQEIIRSEGLDGNTTKENNKNKIQPGMRDDDFNKQGLQVVAGLSRDFSNVKKAAGMDSDVLSSYVSKLEIGLEKVRLVLQHEKSEMEGKFFNSMKLFLKEAEEEITRIKAYERKALSLVKGVTEYFHGDAAKEEAHPFRIFMIVRDFLTILDQVCKEVGKLQDRTMVGTARSFRLSASASLPVLNRYNVRHGQSSDEESSTP